MDPKDIAVTIQTFGEHTIRRTSAYPCGLPDEHTLQMVFDVRLLPDPKDVFPGADGRNPQVQQYVLESEAGKELIPRMFTLIQRMLWTMEKQTRYTSLRIGIMCGGGIQRSPAVAEYVSARLDEKGYPVTIEHLRLIEDGRVASQSPTST